ncbi:MAG TPA: flagellar assembly protein FliW [Candidatus Limnocylindria bacterium]|nr:flagellar assembly protein FliW [Candidatus Limnocylindria bacterium]
MHNEPEPKVSGPGNTGKILHLPYGLLGFEQLKQYQLISNPDEAPFGWLQVLNDPGLAFLVVSPFDVLTTYAPDIGADDAKSIGLEKPEDAELLNIVTLRAGGQSSVNLKGPIVVNRHTLVAKQVIPANAADYSLRHPLPLAE